MTRARESRLNRPGPRLRSGQPNVPLGRRGLLTLAPRFWLALVLTGVGAGLGGAALTALLHAVQHLSFGYTEDAFLHGVERASDLRRVLVLTAAGVVVGVGFGALARVFPGRSGGVSESLWLDRRLAGLRSTLCTAVLQVVTVAMGASLGREAAPKEVGAAIGQQLAERLGIGPTQRRVLLAAGAGAGMAAVYNVPLGGGLFAAEVLLGTLALPVVVPVLLAATVATIVAWLDVPNAPIYAIPRYHGDAAMLPWALMFGPLAGMLAAGFVRAVGWAKQHGPAGWRRPLVAVPVFAALGALAIAYPQVLGNGKGPAQLAFAGSGGLGLLAVLVVLKPLATIACLRAGATGGLFTPALATGALFAAASAHVWACVVPGGAVGAYAIVGGAAVLAAATQGPLSSIVLVYELTRADESLLPATLIAVLGATVVARWADQRSIYTAAFARDAEPVRAGGSGSGATGMLGA